MINLLNAMSIGLAVLISLPAVILSIEILAALLPGKKDSLPESSRRPSIAILIPAHDEAIVIASTLSALKPQLGEDDRLLVVADNCTDNTAEIARGLGAEVIERLDAENHGKGFALDFGIRHLEAAPPEVVIVIDADCLVGEGAVETLALHASAHNRPVQALDLMHPQENAPAVQKVSALAWVIKNQVRPLGLRRMGLPCNLMGTGMAFPWAAIANANLASGEIVEDMKLGLDLSNRGLSPIFCPDAKVTSIFPTSTDAARTQRTRWEHGHLNTILFDVPRHLFRGLFSGNLALFGLALDAVVPPLSFYALTLIIFMILSGLAWILGASSAPFAVVLWAIGLLFGAVFLAWGRYGRDLLPSRTLGAVFSYILWKLPIYARFFTTRQTKWVRTDRDR